jgi:FixJ family two-component response regulator
MRHLGQLMNPRDERNWMIPRPNTKRRQVYDLLVAGKRAGEIMKELNLTRPAYNSHRHFITCWEKANNLSYAVKNADRFVRTVRREEFASA